MFISFSLVMRIMQTRFEGFSFGSIRIDGVTYDHDVVIESRKVKKRNKKPSKPLRIGLATRQSLQTKKFRGDAADW